ncbi:formin-like protein 18 isoform X1 [Amphibalanus amphitrite]|uniref:formin-like protein 18 isoform X1 n=2 Tax=Amphibalanus amphitrite TaxID=1232801 RepID=UPI001C91C89B|nr:formin-like protein 18 isoform X1 [Amphibalanus amphitrite]
MCGKVPATMLSALNRALTQVWLRTPTSQNGAVRSLATVGATQRLPPPPPPAVSALCRLLPLRAPLTPPVAPLALRLPPLAPSVRPLPPPPLPEPVQPPAPSGDRGRRQAARLVVIRRRKMRKHKLKKLRKRMRYVWAKVKLRRSIRREKAFQAEQMAMIADARRFDPRQYMDEIIEKSSTLPMATKRHGKRLPYFIRLEMEKDNLIKPPK